MWSNHVIYYRSFGQDKPGTGTQGDSLFYFQNILFSHDQNYPVGRRVFIVSVYSVWWAFAWPLIYFNLHKVACIIHGKSFYKQLLNTFRIHHQIKAVGWFMKNWAWCQNELFILFCILIEKRRPFLFCFSIFCLNKNKLIITDIIFEYHCLIP